MPSMHRQRNNNTCGCRIDGRHSGVVRPQVQKVFQIACFRSASDNSETVNVQPSSAVLREGTRNGKDPYELSER